MNARSFWCVPGPSVRGSGADLDRKGDPRIQLENSPVNVFCDLFIHRLLSYRRIEWNWDIPGKTAKCLSLSLL